MTRVDLDRLTLRKGSHPTREDGMCAMELVAWLAGEEHSDQPKCASPVLGRFLRALNDGKDDEARQLLKPFLPRVVGTAGDGLDESRGWLATDWLVRVHTPAWLDAAEITESAAGLRALHPIRGEDSLAAAMPVLDRARDSSAAAWDAALAAARDAAWDAAREAALAAARAAALDAARDAGWGVARAAGWGVVRGAARDAALAAARDAARDAAREAARDAAREAGWEAARDAAADRLEPTRVALHASALELLDAMIDPEGTGR